MTAELLFITSPKVTEELVRELQLANKEYPVASPFSPARHVPPARTEYNKAVPDVEFGLFENYTDAQLRAMVQERGKTDRGVYGSRFLVLDDRGAETKSVVVQSCEALFDEETEEIKEWRWFTWRVAFEDVAEMVGVMETKTELFVEVHSKPEPFVDADGIYRVKDAERARGYR